MKVFRYMSEEEAQALIRGEILYNKSNHKKKGKKSNSVGFCFGIGDSKVAHEAENYLNGIVSMEVLVTADLNNKKWRNAKGRYRNTSAHTLEGSMYINELCTISYSRNDLDNIFIEKYPSRKMCEMALAVREHSFYRCVIEKICGKFLLVEMDRYAENFGEEHFKNKFGLNCI